MIVNAIRGIVTDVGRREVVTGQYAGPGRILGARAGLRRCLRSGRGTRSVLCYGSDRRASVTCV